MKSILQDWVMELGLRHQGVLVSAVRGCDGMRKDDPSKGIVCFLRGAILNAHCGDAAKSKSFIEVEDHFADFARSQGVPEHQIQAEVDDLFQVRARTFLKQRDHLPMHYVLHLMHAAEIIGYNHPDKYRRARWEWLYVRIVHSLHLNVETKDQCDRRLGADETTFRAQQEPV